MAWDRNLQPRPQARAWEYWSVRLKKAGEYPAGAPKKHPRAKRSLPAKRGAAARSGAKAPQESENSNQCERRS
jgi:hypothetical protein